MRIIRRADTSAPMHDTSKREVASVAGPWEAVDELLLVDISACAAPAPALHPEMDRDIGVRHTTREHRPSQRATNITVPRWRLRIVTTWLGTCVIESFAAYAAAMYPCIADPRELDDDLHGPMDQNARQTRLDNAGVRRSSGHGPRVNGGSVRSEDAPTASMKLRTGVWPRVRARWSERHRKREVHTTIELSLASAQSGAKSGES